MFRNLNCSIFVSSASRDHFSEQFVENQYVCKVIQNHRTPHWLLVMETSTYFCNFIIKYNIWDKCMHANITSNTMMRFSSSSLWKGCWCLLTNVHTKIFELFKHSQFLKVLTISFSIIANVRVSEFGTLLQWLQNSANNLKISNWLAEFSSDEEMIVRVGKTCSHKYITNFCESTCAWKTK